MTLTGLIKEIKKGNTECQRKLFDKLCGQMYLLCRRYVKSHEDAEERMQDGFCRFFNNIRYFEYKSDAALVQWINTIMVKECLSFLKVSQVYLMPVDEALDLPQEDDVLGKLASEEIFEWLMTLPTGYRTVFNLYFIEGYAHKEIAGMLNISEITSRTQLRHAKKWLQKLIIQNDIGHANEKH